MFIRLTTIEGPALINLEDVHAISPYREGEVAGCDLWWKDHVKDGISMRLADRCTWVEESLEEIYSQLAGDKQR
jgi:hypothetical protein